MMKERCMKTIGRKAGRPVDQKLWTKRREAILDAAASLFAAHGYAETDTQLLVDRLGVGKGTLYRYFPSKRELFLAVADAVMLKMSERVDAAVARVADPLASIAEGIKAYLAFFAEHPGFVELLIQERAQFKDRKKPTYFEHRERRIGHWREVFRRLIAAGRVRAIPVHRITEVMSNLVYGTMFTNYFAGPSKSYEAQTQDILDIVFRGILSDSERLRHDIIQPR
jgi:AcrR family transcriptional regulator